MIQIQCTCADVDVRPMHSPSVRALDASTSARVHWIWIISLATRLTHLLTYKRGTLMNSKVKACLGSWELESSFCKWTRSGSRNFQGGEGEGEGEGGKHFLRKKIVSAGVPTHSQAPCFWKNKGTLSLQKQGAHLNLPLRTNSCSVPLLVRPKKKKLCCPQRPTLFKNKNKKK